MAAVQTRVRIFAFGVWAARSTTGRAKNSAALSCIRAGFEPGRGCGFSFRRHMKAMRLRRFHIPGQNKSRPPAQNRRVYTIELPSSWRAEFFALPVVGRTGHLAERRTPNASTPQLGSVCRRQGCVGLLFLLRGLRLLDSRPVGRARESVTLRRQWDARARA